MPRPAPLFTPSEVVGRRWVIDVCDPKPRKRYLHVTGGPEWMLSGWYFHLAGTTAGGGPLVFEATLRDAMATGVEVPLGTDPLDYACRECGVIWHPAHYSNAEIGMTHRERGLCANCAYWDEAYQDYVAGKRLVVDGQSYTIGREDSRDPASCRGHGGARFRIQYPAGRVVESTNLWSQGVIPERWRDRMPDTATFIPVQPREDMEFRYEGFMRFETRRR